MGKQVISTAPVILPLVYWSGGAPDAADSALPRRSHHAGRTPAEADLLIIEALNAGDVETALSFYEPGATFVAEPGKPATGLEAIRDVLNGFLALKPRLTIEVPEVAESGDLALLGSRWTLKGTGPDGSPVEMAGQGAEVVRRQADGPWKFGIDNHFAGSGG